MSKHVRSWNETVYKRYLCEGRGQESGAEYKPWLTVRDFPSLGVVSRVKGQTTGRVYHLMSTLETKLFYLLDWSDDVLDIREQYPLLKIKEAIEIAEKAQIHYPYDLRSGFPYVMTSDFYVETTNGVVVIAVKPVSELENLRVREKLEIERRYWTEQSIKWEIVTEREINYIKSRNIEWLAQAADLSQLGINEQYQEICSEFVINRLHSSESIPLYKIFSETEQALGLENGTGLNIYKNLAYRKKIDFDINQSVDLAKFTAGGKYCE